MPADITLLYFDKESGQTPNTHPNTITQTNMHQNHATHPANNKKQAKHPRKTTTKSPQLHNAKTKQKTHAHAKQKKDCTNTKNDSTRNTHAQAVIQDPPVMFCALALISCFRWAGATRFVDLFVSLSFCLFLLFFSQKQHLASLRHTQARNGQGNISFGSLMD
ncbi:MAG: hypothetical protein GY714_28740 [Desulfobacterales bacterium]|nr:hypothetical protein [Desulfobacterales bacterium]